MRVLHALIQDTNIVKNSTGSLYQFIKFGCGYQSKDYCLLRASGYYIPMKLNPVLIRFQQARGLCDDSRLLAILFKQEQ